MSGRHIERPKSVVRRVVVKWTLPCSMRVGQTKRRGSEINPVHKSLEEDGAVCEITVLARERAVEGGRGWQESRRQGWGVTQRFNPCDSLTSALGDPMVTFLFN